jgi:trimethylamine-N-oxide reductase (cytochrome c)
MSNQVKAGPWQEPETTVYRGIASGGTGGDPCAIDSKDGRIVRIRPTRWDTNYTAEELKDSFWELNFKDKKFTVPQKTTPPYMALAYKNRVYSKNRVLYPLKRVDWEPGGDPAKINAHNRGISKYERISWDEALDIICDEIKRATEKYGKYTVLCIGEDGHRESKDYHAGGGMHATVMSKICGYTRESRTPDSVEGFYWGAKHVWGSGSNMGLGMIAPPQTGYTSWNVSLDITEYADIIALHAGDLELTQNYASQFYSAILTYWEELGKEIISIDPFCNYTAVCRDSVKWVPILPNTDAAFDMAMMHLWIVEGLYDADYIETHSIGFDKWKAYLMGEDDGIVKDAAWASPLCGVPEWTIKAVAREWGKKVTALVHFSSGAIKGPYSHEPGRTEAYKLAMQGLGAPGVQQMFMNASDMSIQIGQRSSTAPWTSTTKSRMFYPNPSMLPRTMLSTAINEGAVKWWGSPAIVYVKTAEQFQEFNYPAQDEDGSECHIFWSEKPCNMNCWNGGFAFQDAIRNPKVELFITNHQWMENDSLFADIILPCTTVLEEDDMVNNTQIVAVKSIALSHKAVEPLGESMSDYQIAIEVAKRFGVDEEITMGMDREEWHRYAIEQSSLKDVLDYDDLDKRGYVVPPISPDWLNEEKYPRGMRQFYLDPQNFPLDTPTGKIQFYAQELADNFPDDKERPPMATWMIGGPASEGWTHDETLLGEKAKDYPLLVVANPARFRVHVQGDDITWFREIKTVKVKGADGYDYEPIWINPGDAAARGIEAGDIVKLFNDQGIVLYGAIVSERVVPGAVIVHKGSRVDPIAPHLDRGGAINLISPPRFISKHCAGFVVTGYLVEAAKVAQSEMDGWKNDYPEAFARDYDPAIGINRKAWTVE